MLEKNKVHCMDSLEFLEGFSEKSADIIFADPPYALGSELIVDENGKVDYSNACDFMNKWDMPTGEWWERWFREAFRTLKYGGYCIMYGIDRQLLLFKYYACLNGFTEQQSLYWYFASNFPKAVDLSKVIDFQAFVDWCTGNGIDCPNYRKLWKGEYPELLEEIIKEHGKPDGLREIIGEDDIKGNIGYENDDYSYEDNTRYITAPGCELSEKYNGYKYSISPLKQTNETIMVFQKPYKTNSCMRDVIEYEDGDKECRCGALNIDGGRIKSSDLTPRNNKKRKEENIYGAGKGIPQIHLEPHYEERYPAQVFVDEETKKILDEQSDDGCSRILHKCKYEDEYIDFYMYSSKVSKTERNAGLNKHNLHTTLKPIDLNTKILTLFKSPNDDIILYPFAGVGSEVIGGIKAGFDKWYACELSEEFCDIAEKRIEHWSKYDENEIKEIERKNRKIDKAKEENKSLFDF